MADPVELSVRSQLNKIVEELAKIQSMAQKVGKNLEEAGDDVSESLNENTNKAKKFLESMRSLSGRVANQMRSDFKSLLSLNAVQQSLKMSEQFRGAVKETATLSDTIRKLGRTFGMASKDYGEFQNKVTKGLAGLGLSSEAASRTMEGLADTPVRGQKALIEYSKMAGQLASLSGQGGQEGAIAKGIAEVIRARGGDPSDTNEAMTVAEDLRKIYAQTGKGPTEVVKAMQEIFGTMSKDMREKIGSRGLAMLAAGGQVAGPGSTKFLEEMLSKSPIARQALEAQGFKDVFGPEGINIDQFREASKGVLGRVGGDPRLAAQTLGISEEAAEGFVRLAEGLDRVKEAQEGIAKQTGNLEEQYRKSMGMGEAFRANINRVKGMLSEPLTAVTGTLTDVMAKTSESGAGAAATVLGGGALAALLAGMGLKGVGKGLGLGGMATGFAKAKGFEALTGEKVIPVYVTNASEIGGAGGALGAASGMAGIGGKVGKFAGKAGLVGAAAMGGVAIGEALAPVVGDALDKYTKSSTSEGFEGNAMERFFFKLDKLMGGDTSGKFMKQQKVLVELNKRELKETKQPTRGSSF